MVFPASNKILNPESMLFAKPKKFYEKKLKNQSGTIFYIFIVCCTWTRRHTWRLERLGRVQSNKSARVK